MKALLEFIKQLFLLWKELSKVAPPAPIDPAPPVPTPPVPTPPVPTPPVPTPPVPTPPVPTPPIDRVVFAPGEFMELQHKAGKVESLDVKFTFEKLDGNSFPQVDGWLWGMKGNSPEGGEYNLQLHVYNEGGRLPQIRLISQRFDPSCGPKHCEAGDMIPGPFDPDKRYGFHIVGPVRHTSRGHLVWRMTMEDGTKVDTWEITYFGPFASVDYMRIGNGGIFDGRPGQSTPLIVSGAEWL